MKYSLTGMLFPFDTIYNTVVLLKNGEQFLFPIFTTIEKYEEAAVWGKFQSAKVKMISNPSDFIDSVLECRKKVEFIVAVDPYITESGNTRFNALILE